MRKDNNQLIAERIYEIENAGSKQRKEWREQNLTRHKLTDDIYMTRSEDCIMWYLWKYNPDKCEYGYFKCVPSLYYGKDAIEKLLEAQSWCWI